MATVSDRKKLLINGYLREFSNSNKLSNRIPDDINDLVISLFPIIGIESEMLTNDENEQLMTWIDNSQQCDFKLLFKGTRDGFASTEFHKKCDGKGSTISIVKSNNAEDHIFGGFSSKSWHNNVNDPCIRDDFAWLYSLRNAKRTPKKFKIVKNQNKAMCGSYNYGPTYGWNPDLYIPSNCNVNNSFTILGGSYDGGSDPYQLNGGAKYFKVLDYEVWQIVKKG